MQTIFTTFIGVSAVSSESSSSRKSTIVRDFSFSSLSNFQNVNLLNKSQIPRSKVIHILQHLSTNQNRCILKRSRKCFYKACLLRYLCLRDFLFKKKTLKYYLEWKLCQQTSQTIKIALSCWKHTLSVCRRWDSEY